MDGAFVVSGWETGADLTWPLHLLNIATGFSCKQLVHKVKARPAGHPAIEEWVGWLETPFAAQLLREQLKGKRCDVLPVRLSGQIVADTRKELFSIMEPSPGTTKRRRQHRLGLTPLLLTHRSSGESVYLNEGAPLEELRRLAHALLAVKLRRR